MKLEDRDNARLRRGADHDRQLGTLGIIFEDFVSIEQREFCLCYLLSFYHGNFHIAADGDLEALLGSIVTPHLGEEFPRCLVVGRVVHRSPGPLQWKGEFSRGL